MSQIEIIDDDISFRNLSQDEQRELTRLRKEYSNNYMQVNRAQWAIIGIIVIEIIFGIVAIVTDSVSSNGIMIAALVILLFAIALVLTFSHVVAGLVIALALYVILTIIVLANEPLSITRGVLLKLLIFYLLINGIFYALKNVPILKAIESLGGEAPAHSLI